IGTGTYTAIAMIVSHETGISIDKIEVVLGDSSLPPGPISGGSWATASVTPAVLEASQKAVASLVMMATKTPGTPFSKKQPKELEFVNGCLRTKGQTNDSVSAA